MLHINEGILLLQGPEFSIITVKTTVEAESPLKICLKYSISQKKSLFINNNAMVNLDKRSQKNTFSDKMNIVAK